VGKHPDRSPPPARSLARAAPWPKGEIRDYDKPAPWLADDAPLFYGQHWHKLPLRLRRRWWRETDYGALEPSPELIEAIRTAPPKAKRQPSPPFRREHWEEWLDGAVFHLTLIHEPCCILWVTRSLPGEPEMVRAMVGRCLLCVEPGVPEEIILRALACLPDARPLSTVAR
jgi:hypothetical protein